MTSTLRLSVIVKTLNEELNIEKAILAIRQCLRNISYEIIVADSLSVDRTQEIALSLGARVVSLVNEADRCCGVGPQLGYLYSQGQYLLLLDADMILEPGFIEKAITFLDNNHDYAGVAGSVILDDGNNYEFRSRKNRIDSIYPLGDCDHLGGGGLYRKSAIDKIGYLTNRNLHALEEAELGMRLNHAGFKMHRLNVPYFSHKSYAMGSFEMLKHRWKTKRFDAAGELLRSAFLKGYFTSALKHIKNEVIFAIYLIILSLTMLSLNLSAIIIMLFPLCGFFTLKALKTRSLFDAMQSILILTTFSAALIRGLFKQQVDPVIPPENKQIREINND